MEPQLKSSKSFRPTSIDIVSSRRRKTTYIQTVVINSYIGLARFLNDIVDRRTACFFLIRPCWYLTPHSVQ